MGRLKDEWSVGWSVNVTNIQYMGRLNNEWSVEWSVNGTHLYG